MMRKSWPIVQKASEIALSMGMLGLLCLMVSASLRADTVYTYTGNSFTTAQNDCCAVPQPVIPGYISGSITLTSPLPDNLAPGTDISALLQSFTITANNGNPEGPGVAGVVTLEVGTNANGAIDDWNVQFFEDFGYNLNYLTTINDPSDGVYDLYNIAGGAGYNESVSNDPGVWACTSGCSATAPEPGTSSLTLIGIGLLLATRRRIAPGLQQAP
jgi:PEP-CTERM motif